MCGRYTVSVDPAQLAERFNAAPPATELQPRYNAAPSQSLPVLLNEGERQIQLLKWGLIPKWAKTASDYNLINARAETVEEKPAFREALQKRRCLVLSDGFYEWRKTPTGKVPMLITLKSGEPFAFAGLWENWKDPEGELIRTFTIITTTPNDLMATIHNRMPVILPREDEDRWIDNASDVSLWRKLMQPYPADLMKAYPVSARVNSPANDTPAVMAPLAN